MLCVFVPMNVFECCSVLLLRLTRVLQTHENRTSGNRAVIYCSSPEDKARACRQSKTVTPTMPHLAVAKRSKTMTLTTRQYHQYHHGSKMRRKSRTTVGVRNEDNDILRAMDRRQRENCICSTHLLSSSFLALSCTCAIHAHTYKYQLSSTDLNLIKISPSLF